MVGAVRPRPRRPRSGALRQGHINAMDLADKTEYTPTAEEVELVRPMLKAYAEVVADMIDATDRGDLDTVQARSMESMIKGMPLCGAFQVLAR